jgi:hypothetical protein
MSRILAAEWHKLRTVRGPWWLLGWSFGLALALALAQLAIGDRPLGGLRIQGVVADIRTPADMRDFVAFAAAPVSFLALILGLTLATGEYQYATIVRTALAVPRRWPLAIAKVLIAAAGGLVMGATAVAAPALTAVAWLTAHDAAIPLGAPAARALLQLPLATALEAGLAAAVALLIRRQITAFAVVFGWVFLAESVLVGLVPDSKRWVPFTGAAQAILSGPSDRLLDPWLGAGLLVAYLALATALAALALARRDVP